MDSKLDTDDKACYVQTLHHTEPFDNSTAFDGWDLEYIQISAGKYECYTKEIRLDGLQIYTEEGNSVVHEFGAAWGNSYVFAMPCQMKYEGRINGQLWHRTVAAFRGENEFDVLVPPMKLLIVGISRDLFADHLINVEHITPQEWLKGGMQMVDDPIYVSLVTHTLSDLIDYYCTDPANLSSASAQAGVMQVALESVSPLILSKLEPPIIFNGFSRTQIVRKAREFVLANIDGSLQISDVCRALGISRRALQYSFQDVLKVNPIAYLRFLRLNGARRDLLNAGERPIQVKDVIARWGFWHFSRFSAEYKQLFNELPSETLRKALLETSCAA